VIGDKILPLNEKKFYSKTEFLTVLADEVAKPKKIGLEKFLRRNL